MRRGENIYHRKDGRWEGRYIKGRKTNGRIHYGYVYGWSLSEVRTKIYPLKIKYQSLRQLQGEATQTLEEWGCHWLATIQAEVKASTYANYYHKLTHYVFPVLGTCPLNELNEPAGKKLVAHLQVRLAPSTIRGIFRIVNQCLTHALEKQQLLTHPFRLLKLPKVKKVKVNSLTRAEQRRLEEAALKRKGYGLPTVLALHSGMRIGEIAALRWEDLDFEQNTIRIQHTYQRVLSLLPNQKTQLIYASTKTDSSSRVIPMGKKIKRFLLQHRPTTDSRFVFSTKQGPSEPRLLTYHFHQIRQAAGLDAIHFHQLRHTFATRCIESKGDIVSISALLGHSSSQMTLDTYTNSMLEQRIQVMQAMEQAI